MFNQLAAIFARDSFDGIEDETDNTLAELLAKTLNTHYTVRETVVPNSFEQPRLRYFGIGIDGTLSNGTVRIPKSNNGWLYHPIPIRVMTLADEALLDAEVRALYRMRNTVTVSGTTYVQYWLKVIDWEDITAVQTQQITAGANPTSHILDIDKHIGQGHAVAPGVTDLLAHLTKEGDRLDQVEIFGLVASSLQAVVTVGEFIGEWIDHGDRLQQPLEIAVEADDPIVAEVRKYRAEHTRRFNADLHLICEDLRKFEQTLGGRVIRTAPRRLEPTSGSTVQP